MKKNKLFVSLLAAGMLAISPAMADDVVKITTNKATGETVTLQLNHARKGYTVDWGDGNAISVVTQEGINNTVTGTLKGQTITISTASKITTLDCTAQGVTALDLSGSANLQSLFCADNELSELDLAKNAKLLDLNCSNNSIVSLKLNNTNNPLVENLVASNNKIKNNGTGNKFEFSSNSLHFLDVSKNAISTLTLSTVPNLNWINCSDNEISSLNIKSATSVDVVKCDNNKLTSLNVDSAKVLYQLDAANNNLGSFYAGKADGLKYFNVENNNLSKVTLSKSANFYAYICGGNKLTFPSLPKRTFVQNISYLPQNVDSISITNKLKFYAGSYYLLTCPQKSYYTNKDLNYVLNLTDYKKDLNGYTTPELSFRAIPSDATEPVFEELIFNNKNFFRSNDGIVAFRTAQKEVYAVITSTDYPELTLKTTHFRVVDDKKDLTAINNVVADKVGSTLSIATQPGVLILSTDAEKFVSVYGSTGQLMWQGIVNGNKRVNLATGVYIVNGKKVVL